MEIKTEVGGKIEFSTNSHSYSFLLIETALLDLINVNL